MEAGMKLIHGNCLDVMAQMEESSINACITDPPYGISFMGKDWDHGVPGIRFWQEVLRVCKPGAHLLAFGGTRTFHRLACVIEDAKWEIRDCLMWVYGSGFPKSHNVSKSIDRQAGAERKIVAYQRLSGNACVPTKIKGGTYGVGVGTVPPQDVPITVPVTEEAQQWDGWGTALKPAWEPIIMARKPLEGTVAKNVLQYGTGGLNIDGCRIGADTRTYKGSGAQPHKLSAHERGDTGIGFMDGSGKHLEYTVTGRWPANLMHDGSEEAIVVMGEASRYFYCAKANRRDRDDGCENLDKSINHHPTVKPTELMQWLCRLITPPHGVILDPFMGSGSTGKAAVMEGFHFIGIDIMEEYVEIARARIEAASKAQERDGNIPLPL